MVIIVPFLWFYKKFSIFMGFFYYMKLEGLYTLFDHCVKCGAKTKSSMAMSLVWRDMFLSPRSITRNSDQALCFLMLQFSHLYSIQLILCPTYVPGWLSGSKEIVYIETPCKL